MAHLAENSRRLAVRTVSIQSGTQLLKQARGIGDVCLLWLPAYAEDECGGRLQEIEQLVAEVSNVLGPEATLIIVGELTDLVHIHAALSSLMRYQLWIAIKRNTIRFPKHLAGLPQHHYGALIHTKYKASLRHAKTRIRYTYCPVCDKTTKDYGGKKHTYHEFGTLISDVWRDIAADLESNLAPVVDRFADLFGVHPYKELRVFDCRGIGLKRSPYEINRQPRSKSQNGKSLTELVNELTKGDCLEELKKISDNSVDFAFADPPYNLRKTYAGYDDELEITDYFKWCDEWISELARVLRPGRTCAILNIPLWATRHFLHLERVLQFQNWIVWDALSFPVRFIMPSHYAILCFSKGAPRTLPGLTSGASGIMISGSYGVSNPLQLLAEGYCLRANCIETRRALRVNDRGPLTDLWWDIHRLKHNSRRVDHPCQLPPQLMYRLISIFTHPGEMVLDCFDGVGTTTLAAHQLDRKYIGVEISERYHALARTRHEEIDAGLDPFRKAHRLLTAKNSPVPRIVKQKYVVPKKTLQLEVKRVAALLGHLPTREELKRHGKYPIDYYGKYFSSWGEVCAAARTTGMVEYRTPKENAPLAKQLELFVMELKGRYGNPIRVKRKANAVGKNSTVLSPEYFEQLAGIMKTRGKLTRALLRERAADRQREDRKTLKAIKSELRRAGTQRSGGRGR